MKWLLVLLITIMPLTASAHGMKCANYFKLKSDFNIFYGERTTHRGYLETVEGPIIGIEIWEAKDKSTFSIILLYPDGNSCIVVTGQKLKWLKDAWDEPA